MVELFRHEIGHYFDLSPREISQAFSVDPEFKRLIQRDLKAAYRSKNPAVSLTKNSEGALRLSETERAKLRKTNMKNLKRMGLPPEHIEEMVKREDPHLDVPTAEHVGYYAPISEIQEMNERHYREAFAEIFAGLFGGGEYQKVFFGAGCLSEDC